MPTFFAFAAAGAAVVASLFPAAAGPEPSAVWIEGGMLYFDAAERAVNVVSVEPYGSDHVLVRDTGGTPIRPADPCLLLAPGVVLCPRGGLHEMTTVLRGEDDQFNGGPWKDIVYGGPGDDTLLGGKGNDELHGEAGYDTLDGQAGAADDADGGTEKDTCTAEHLDNCE